MYPKLFTEFSFEHTHTQKMRERENQGKLENIIPMHTIHTCVNTFNFSILSHDFHGVLLYQTKMVFFFKFSNIFKNVEPK